MTSRSSELFRAAHQLIPGGVNSPVRALRNVGGEPFFVDRAAGSKIWDVDGNEYVDYVGSWGPAILGHAPKVVVDAVCEAAARGLSFGIPNPLEVEMADLICQWVPSIEKVRMVNSGTEAAMSCIRLARGFTGRGARLYRSRQNHQVRRLLSWTCRRTARAIGEWRAHPWNAGQRRCAASVYRPDNFAAV